MTKKERTMYGALSVEINKLEDVPVGLIEAIKEYNLKYGVVDDESDYTDFETLCEVHIHDIADDCEETIDSDFIYKNYIGELNEYVIIATGSQYRKDGGLCPLEMDLGFKLHVNEFI